MDEKTYTAFKGSTILESGSIETVLEKAVQYLKEGNQDYLAIYDDESGYVIDFDFRGTLKDVLDRLPDHPMFSHKKGDKTGEKRGRGRPRLGVVSKEVTLLPRHWQWLANQRGGASVTLRRLVDDARKLGQGKELAEKAKEALHRFLWDIASNLENFEEVTRSFYQNDYSRVFVLIDSWPDDIKSYTITKLMKIVELDKQE